MLPGKHRNDPIQLPAPRNPTSAPRPIEKLLPRPKWQLVGPCGRELMTEVRSDISFFGRQIVRILWLLVLIFLRLTDRVLIRIAVEHAPAGGHSFFKPHLEAVGVRIQ